MITVRSKLSIRYLNENLFFKHTLPALGTYSSEWRIILIDITLKKSGLKSNLLVPKLGMGAL